MTDFQEQNKGAIKEEAKSILQVMLKLNLRRRGECLFTVYGSRKLYVTIKEFVWTHIKHPYLAECTVPVFTQLLLNKEAKTTIKVRISEQSSEASHNTSFYLGETIHQMCQVYLSETDFLNYDKKFKVMKYKLPEDSTTRTLKLNDLFNDLSLGDLGFTDGTEITLQ